MLKASWHIVSNERIAERVFRMILRGDTAGIAPGQFVEVLVPGCYLRRPLSVGDVTDDRLTLIYKTVGEGTARMAQMSSGQTLDILTGLGHGYDLTKAGEQVLLIGGGVGVPPLMYAAKELRAAGKHVQVVMGFNSKDEVFGEDTFRAMGCEVTVCTMDGSYGTRGVVTDVMPTPTPFYYACGPMPMIKAILRTAGTNGQISMEERMGCGVGLCMGCTIETTKGFQRVCKEGPVFDGQDIKDL